MHIIVIDCEFVFSGNICKQLNPCEHGGVCVVSTRKFMCHCTGTGYYGKRCEKSKTKLVYEACLLTICA